MLWALSQSNLGRVLLDLADATGKGQFILEAVQAFRSAMSAYDRDSTARRLASATADWGHARGLAGLMYRNAEWIREGLKALNEAISSLENLPATADNPLALQFAKRQASRLSRLLSSEQPH